MSKTTKLASGEYLTLVALANPSTGVPYTADGGASSSGGVSQTTISQVVGVTSTQVLAADPLRRALLIQNQSSTQTLYVGIGGTAAPTSLIIGPGGSYEPYTAPTNSIHLAASAAGVTVFIAHG